MAHEVESMTYVGSTPWHRLGVPLPEAPTVEAAIVAGELVAGDRLPSERQLAQQFAVSRTSIREALRVLEALGVVRVRPGAEHGATLVDAAGDALRDILQFQLALRHISIASLVEFRLVIESWSARCEGRRHSTSFRR